MTPPKTRKPGETAKAIRTAIVTISARSDSRLRSVLDAYLPCVSPSMARRGSECFPRPLKRAPLNQERTSHTFLGDLVCFHIGMAILAYYDLIPAAKEPPKAWTDLNQARMDRLAVIATGHYRKVGTVTLGFCLEALP